MIITKICVICKKEFDNKRKTANIKHGSYRLGKIQFSKMKCCSVNCMGKWRIGMKFSKEHKKNLSEAKLKGRIVYYKKCIICGEIILNFRKSGRGLLGIKQFTLVNHCSKECFGISHKDDYFPKEDKSHVWKGDAVGYSGLHEWVRKHLGRPQECEHCGKNGLTGHQIHWSNKSKRYKRKLLDWQRLCAKCHKVYDMGRGRRNIYVSRNFLRS